MLAAIMVISILSGFVGVGATQMLDLPLWAALLAYPIGGCIGLIATAALLTRSPREPAPAVVLCATQQQ